MKAPQRTKRGKEDELLQVRDCGQIRTHASERKRKKKGSDTSGRTHLHLSPLLYFLQFSSILFPILFLLPPLLPFLPFPSMYIFRSRVINSAPAGMCWNRISLILPCPHCAAKTQIRINTCM